MPKYANKKLALLITLIMHECTELLVVVVW